MDGTILKKKMNCKEQVCDQNVCWCCGGTRLNSWQCNEDENVCKPCDWYDKFKGCTCPDVGVWNE